MSKDNTNKLSNALVFATCFVFIVTGLVIAKQSTPLYFVFQRNGYGLLSAAQVITQIALLVALFLRRGYIQARLWLAIDICGSMLLGLGELLTRLSTSPSQAIFWSHVSTIGLAIVPVGFYMFSRSFIAKPQRRFDAVLPALLVSTAGLLLAFVIGSDSIELEKYTRGFWGYGIPLSSSFLLLTVWLGAIVGLGLKDLWSYHQRVTIKTQKSQALVIIVGVGTAVASGIIFDVIPRYYGHNILPVGVILQSLVPLTIIFAIYRYDTFAVDFSQSGDDILNALSEAVIITDAFFTIKSINSFGLKLSGYHRRDLVGSSLWQLFSDSEQSVIQKTVGDDIPFDEQIKIEDTKLLMKNSTSVDVSVSITRVVRSAPLFLFTIGDISEAKRFYDVEQAHTTELEKSNQAFSNQQRAMMNLLEDSRDLSEQLVNEKAGVERKVEQRTAEVKAERLRLEASINSLNVGFIIIDDKRKIITTNRAFSTIIDLQLGTQPDLDQLTHKLKRYYDIQRAIDNCLLKGTEVSKDGIKFDTKVLRIFMAPIFEDTTKHKSLGVVVLVEDVTEAKNIERSRDEFFSIASHELRTPLTAIRGNTQMIKEYFPAVLADPPLAEMIEDIHDSSIRLITIVNDFLDTSRLEQGQIKFEFSDFDVKDLVLEVMQEFEAGEVNPQLYLRLGAETPNLPLIHADRNRLKQTIINLIGNAFKFTEIGGVTIDLSATNKMVTIAVTDTGKGIPAESQNLLFRKFQQASNNILTRDSTRSTGLGLYISKLIAEGMKGKIYMKASIIDKGSTFVIEMPVLASKARRLSPKKSSRSKQ
jgi:PAS domain S-box-containing protein